MRMPGSGGDGVKVKIVVTRHVQTDVAQFKSLVQDLTGKDAVVSMEPDVPKLLVTDTKPRRPPTRGAAKGSDGAPTVPPSPPLPPPGVCCELDRLLKELPSLDELHDLWKDY